MRQESRGGHTREDYPKADPEWAKKNVVTHTRDGRLELATDALPTIPEELRLAVTRQLEDAAAARQDSSFRVADDEPGVRRRVVVVHQLEQEAEPAALAGDGHVVDLL